MRALTWQGKRSVSVEEVPAMYETFQKEEDECVTVVLHP